MSLPGNQGQGNLKSTVVAQTLNSIMHYLEENEGTKAAKQVKKLKTLLSNLKSGRTVQ